MKWKIPLYKGFADSDDNRAVNKVIQRGMDWAIVAWDMDQLLRNKLKYGDLLPNTRAELEEIRNTLNEMLIDRGLQYPA